MAKPNSSRQQPPAHLCPVSKLAARTMTVLKNQALISTFGWAAARGWWLATLGVKSARAVTKPPAAVRRVKVTATANSGRWGICRQAVFGGLVGWLVGYAVSRLSGRMWQERFR
jgi:hypothetical protein